MMMRRVSQWCGLLVAGTVLYSGVLLNAAPKSSTKRTPPPKNAPAAASPTWGQKFSNWFGGSKTGAGTSSKSGGTAAKKKNNTPQKRSTTTNPRSTNVTRLPKKATK